MTPQPPPTPAPACPARVEIYYEVDAADGSSESRQLPFVIGVLADCTGHPADPLPRLRDRRFVEINADNFDYVMRGCNPRVAIAVPATIEPDDPGMKLRLDLRFQNIEDFAPESVARQIPPLRAMLELRIQLEDLRAAIQADNRLDEAIRNAALHPSMPRGGRTAEELADLLISEGHFGRFAENRERAQFLLASLIEESDQGRIANLPTADAMLAERIASMDELVSAQLNEVFHHPDFQRMEATWRGLDQLVRPSRAPSPDVKIKVLNVTKKELLRDLQRAPAFDQSGVFHKVYDEEFAMVGGEPYAALIGDYYFGKDPADVELLDKLSQIAAASHAPFIGAAAPGLFNLDSFRELGMPRDLSRIFDATEYAKWHSFRRSDDSRYAGLVLPRVLLRLPYGRDGIETEGFDYQEGVEGIGQPEHYLWGAAVYPFAARLIEAFTRWGWCTALSGMERAGVVRSLPMRTFISDEGDSRTICPAEIAITDRRRDELHRLGFIPLCHEKGTDRAIFFEANSCQQPRAYSNPRATEIAMESARLEYAFAFSRFAHYIRAITRVKSGTFQNQSEWSRYLNDWIAGYVLLDDDAEPDVKARFPLREGSVDVREVPGRPRVFNVVARLRPHFQLSPPGQPVPESVDTIDINSGGRLKADS